MREDKYDKLLNASIVLLIVSATVLAISVYNMYIKEPTKSVKKSAIQNNKSTERDSLQSIYTNTIKGIDSTLLLDSVNPLNKEVKAKFAEMNILKSEIATLLKDQSTDADLTTAKLKIEELQLKVALLQNRYTGVESENKRLQKLIEQLMANSKMSTSGTTTSYTGKEKNKGIIEKTPANNTAITLAGDLRLFAIAESNAKEIETSFADDAEKIVGSFLFKANASKGNGEVIVVVVQPDGRVIKNSAWESGTFETSQGKKVYSRKLFVEPQGEEKRLNFSLMPDSFLKGDYTLQVWYNGNMIGRVVKTLS